ncbi:MAG: crossover junction endodeoxyribonuclease RuvC [Actinobacteria bacterium]|nr:crossover junction endodeoxyribonuclease RuvC [Actinomycetota bacterium]
MGKTTLAGIVANEMEVRLHPTSGPALERAGDLAAEEAGVRVAEYPPTEVKLGIAGSGTAGKEQVRRALERLVGLEGVPDSPDAADAVAIAVCHLGQSRLRSLVARA